MTSSTVYCVSGLLSDCSHTKRSRVLSVLLVFKVALLCAALTCACALQPRYAYAEDATVEVVRTSNVISYGNYQTTELQANGNIAYCAEPLKQLPANGVYSTQAASGDLKEAMWYSYGAPGFDAHMWPVTNYRGKAMTANDYYVASHVLLAYFYTGSAWQATYAGEGAEGEVFTAWAKQYILGIDADGNQTLQSPALTIKTSSPNFYSGFTALIILSGADSTQTLMSYSLTGSMQLTKTLSLTCFSSSLFSVANATFGVFTDEACTKQIGTLVTNAAGTARLDALPLGTVYVKELQAPVNTVLNNTVYSVTISGSGAMLAVANKPQSAEAKVLLYKQDAACQTATAQGDASLAGAVYRLSYFDNLEGNTSNSPDATWELATNENGAIDLSDAENIEKCLRSGTLYFDEGKACLPVGTYTIQEIQAPVGYLLDETQHVFTVTSTDEAPDNCIINIVSQTPSKENVPLSNEQIIRGDVQLLKKLDGVELSAPEQGLAGTTFQICNASESPIYIDATWYEPGDVVMEIVASWNSSQTGFTAQTANNALPYGTYSIQEVSAPEGIELTDTQVRYFQIRENGKTVTVDVDENPLVFVNKAAETPVNPPVDPEDPDDAGGSGNPDDPNGNGNKNPSGTDTGDNGNGNNGNGNSGNGNNGTPNLMAALPQTGDKAVDMLIALFMLSVVVGAAVVVRGLRAKMTKVR